MRIAVTGAAGRLGGQVVRLLAEQPGHDVVALSRREPAAGRRRARVTPATADYDDRPALRAALRAADTLVFISSDGEAVRVLQHHQNVIAAAADCGVTHVVALSGLDADVRSPFCYAVTYGHTERLLRDSGCGFSIARASIFTEFFRAFLNPARAAGEIRLPAGDGRISLVSRPDVARCLAALAVAPPTGAGHDITGPQSLDLPAIAAQAARRWGAPVTYVDLAPAEYSVELARAGEEPWWQYAYSTLFDSVRQHRWRTVSGEVSRLTGRSPERADEVLFRPGG
ncbi:MAG TPA: NAD(P)H-binding protein [Streptosporangiaceae bacterium]